MEPPLGASLQARPSKVPSKSEVHAPTPRNAVVAPKEVRRKSSEGSVYVHQHARHSARVELPSATCFHSAANRGPVRVERARSAKN